MLFSLCSPFAVSAADPAFDRKRRRPVGLRRLVMQIRFSLRWHYPNQVLGNGRAADSQPITMSSPGFLFFSWCFALHQIHVKYRAAGRLCQWQGCKRPSSGAFPPTAEFLSLPRLRPCRSGGRFARQLIRFLFNCRVCPIAFLYVPDRTGSVSPAPQRFQELLSGAAPVHVRITAVRAAVPISKVSPMRK